MANLENNNQNNDKGKSVAGQISESVQKRVDNVQETVKGAAELAKDAVTHPVETAQEFGKQAAKDVTSVKWWARLLQVVFWVGLFLVASVFIIINLDVTKKWAAIQALQVLNRDFKAEMSTESVTMNYFGDVQIKGLRIKDYKGMEFIKAKEFRADSDWISLAVNSIRKSNALSFNALQLRDADIKVVTYKGDSISNFVRYTRNFSSNKKKDPNAEPFQLNSRVEILNSKVSIVNQNSEGDKGTWLLARNVNIIAPKVKVNGSNVSAQINNMTFITKRWDKEHFVDTFSTDLSLTNQFLSLKDLTLNTDHSLLQGDLRFRLNNGSWADFADRVGWDMNLKLGSQISGYDISYFVTNWDNYKPVNISGKMTGPLNRFYLEDFVMGNGEVKIRTSTMKFQDILKGNFLIETRDVSTDFTYKGLKAMLPGFIAVKLKNFADDFGRLKYAGSARLTPKQIYIPNGNLVTGIGQAKISQLYLTDYSTPMPKYKGYLEVRDLNAAAITKNKTVGLVTGKFNVDGQSFDVNTMRLRTRSEISRIEILDKEINNVFLDGLLDHKVYTGVIKVNDEQAKADVNGLINFQTSKIIADIKADIRYLNINYFTGTPGSQVLSGQIDGKVAMTNLNDLDLDADFNNLSFTNGLTRYLVSNAKVRAFFENGNRVLSVDAPGAVTGKISGRFNLGDLPGMIKNGIGKILVGPPPRKLYRGQNFAMNFDVRQGVVSYFLPDLRIPHGATVNGQYDGNSNNLVLNVDAASLKYYLTTKKEITDADRALAAANPAYHINTRNTVSRDSAMVDNLIVRINTANLDEQIFAKVDRAEYNQNVLKNVTFTGRNENNSILHLAANLQHGSPEDEINGEMKTYTVSLNQTTNRAGDIVVRFEPTEVKFNNVVWKIDTDPTLNHSITYRKKTKDFYIENFRVYSDDSELLVKTATFKSTKDFQADAELKNFQISKILEMQAGGNNMGLQGLANGTLNIKMDQNNLQPLIDLTVDGIRMNNEEMGSIVISAKNSGTRNIFDIEAKVISSGLLGNNSLMVSGTVNNNTPSPTLDIKATMNDFDLKFANTFVKNVFSNMRGKANGVLAITGNLKNIDYSGDIALNDFGLKLNFTGVDYSFEDTTTNLSRGLAVLNNIAVSDGRSNSGGTISGAIRFETLSAVAVNLVLNARNLMVLNTTQKDYDLFWGRVYGQGDLFISGPVSGLSIETPGKSPFRALNNSTFTFNSGSNSNVEEFKMLRFLKEDKTGIVTIEDKKSSGANMNIDFNLALDRGTTINVLVGDGVGDISVRGTADNLNFRMSRQGAINMVGTYYVDNGTFVSKAILNRTFQIAKGSNIQWDGEAMSPALDITANYMRTVSNAGDYLNVGYLQPINVVLQTKISQTLNNPKIELDVTAMDVSSQVKETLAAKLNQEDEKVLQFGSILVLNRFNTSDLTAANTIENVAADSGYNLLFKQLGSVLNNISNEFQIDLNYVKGDNASNTGDRANAGVSFAVSPRVSIKTGLGIPLSRGTESADKDVLSGEGTVEIDVSKKNDGSLIVRGYSKPMNIGMNSTTGSNGTANQTYGAGVVYTKSFNTIFKRKKKNQGGVSANRNNTEESEVSDTVK